MNIFSVPLFFIENYEFRTKFYSLPDTWLTGPTWYLTCDCLTSSWEKQQANQPNKNPNRQIFSTK